MPIPIKEPWSSKPFVRLLIPFVLGILLCFYTTISLVQISIIGLIGLLIFFSFYLLPLTQKFIWGWISGVGINLLVLAFGSGICYAYNPTNHEDWVGYHLQKNQELIICLLEPPSKKTRSWKALAKVEAIKINVAAGTKNEIPNRTYHTNKNPGWLTVNGKIFLYCKNQLLAEKLHAGSRIRINSPLQKIHNNPQSGNFNYQQWAAFQQIYFQTYLADTSCIQLAPEENYFSFLLFATKNKILATLRKYIPEKKEAGVAEALLIGYKEDLDKPLLQAYSNTGVVHIIAISGMHLGMIYGLLVFLFKLFTPNKWTEYLKPLTILFVLWSFAFLTGGAAAILRSAVTFSFLLFSERLGYKNNTINALAASACCLLVYDPYLLWDIGFQLSYAAVTGIVLYAKTTNNWFLIKNPLLKQIWQVNAVTLSAQVFTLPLVLFHFHQFPNFFLFSNFLIVPLSGIVLYFELLLLFPIPFLQWQIGKLLYYLIAAMNGIIERTNRIPYAVTTNLQPSLIQTVLLFLALFAFLHWLQFKKNRAFILGLGLLVSMFILQRIDLLLEKSLLKPTFAAPFKATKPTKHAKENPISTDIRFL